ncbi:aspartate ammonia-lyase [Kiritimatiella glycovorans]|uniref:Aspartate ammonia-lyase n=1 Tax=Kiritimatiella glycovorans TaxID=1307763 RepID=A0A0G3EGL0_9BACT|nr:aspartate ammonia-lyase [Kiritimatiella glycovorans]AKJ65483.1 Aspartate ammonia-lyase [Kiritimatiella glycovorans]
MRTEKDGLGTREVPDDALFGIHTLRSMENFGSAGAKLPLELIYAMARIKRACARANRGLGLLEKDTAEAIQKACDAVLAGGHDDQFPVDVFQAGSGTSSHMNLNEVLANLAAIELGGAPGDRDRVHPNDDVNRGQSTNNVFPSAIRVAVVLGLPELDRAAEHLEEALEERARAFAGVRKSGRTHLQDAVPITLGMEFAAWARAVRKDRGRLDAAAEPLRELGVGGNAVGTGLNTPHAFREKILAALNEDTGGHFAVAEDGVEATQFLTDAGAFSGALRAFAHDLLKIVNDLRLLSSGPRTGLGEITLPAVEPGSSIMPGKLNPSICEAANMACMQVLGLDHAVSLACGAGQLELNTHMPLVGANLITSARIIRRICTALADRCIRGIEANEAVCRRNFEQSAGLATVLNPVLGYDRVCELVRESVASGRPMSELVSEKGLMSDVEWQRLVEASTGPSD